jgi:hypothetical protein
MKIKKKPSGGSHKNLAPIFVAIFCVILFSIYCCFTIRSDRKIRNAERTPPRDLEESRSRNVSLPGLNSVAPGTIRTENLSENEPHENEDNLPHAYNELFETS